METLNKPLAKNSRNANPKEHSEVLKGLELKKFLKKSTKGSTSSKVHIASLPEILNLDMKMTHPLRLEKCNLESFLKAPMKKKFSFGFSLDRFGKLKS